MYANNNYKEAQKMLNLQIISWTHWLPHMRQRIRKYEEAFYI